MIKYGLISETDARALEVIINLIHTEYGDGRTYITEIGCYSGETGNGMRQYVEANGGGAYITGIDNNKDGEALRFQYDKLIIGNSSEVYNQLEDNSQHLVFIDGCHTFPAVVADFFCYAPKVKVGGYLAFHDTGKHINPLHGWQGVGDKNDPDMCLGGVMKALQSVGLFGGIEYEYGEGKVEVSNRLSKWELVFDEADPNDEAGGICVFKKLY